jgi:scyllo-inositol 2-dehydrogenase (NADP+)
MGSNAVVVGYGKSLHTRIFHCDAIKNTEGLNLYGICARNPQFQEEARKVYGVKVYSSFAEVLQDEQVDLVAISTPSYCHAEMAIQALNAGKHVAVEKPMCLKVSEAEAMIEAARQKGRILTTRQNRRWDSDFLTVRKVLSDGKISPVFLLHLAYTDLLKPTGWRAQRGTGGGVIYDLGSHLIDQVLQLMSVPPLSVFAFTGTWGWDVDSETYARVLLRFADGSRADIELSHNSWIPRPRWYILGAQGSLASEKGKFLLRTKTGPEELEPVPAGKEGFYANVAQALQGKAKAAVTPEESKLVIRIIEAAFWSAESGQVVDL